MNISNHHNIPDSVLTGWIQEEIDHLRQNLLEDKWNTGGATQQNFIKYLLDKVDHRARLFSQQNLRRVINGTGVILHTNLGRARLSENAVRAVQDAAVHYSNLEYHIEKGERGSRHEVVESLICEVTGSESAMVVNNNAAAVFLILRALANDKDVIVSRGQLVEIGGSFRVSSIMEESGARLAEVGTTNKTHLYDYEKAVSVHTAMLMKVHTSNFKMKGFTQSVDRGELVELADKHGLIFYEDLGSGAFYDFSKHGIGDEPLVSEVIDSGLDLVTCSGDKLLGGPQAGIIAGKKKLVDKLKQHQLARVLRVDKMTLAALEETLKDYIREEVVNIPTVRDIVSTEKEIKERAERFIDFMASAAPNFHCHLASEDSRVGGGTMPDVSLPTWGAVISRDDYSSQSLANALRECDPPVITRMKNEKVYIDFRTVANEEIEALISSLRQLD